MSKITFKSKNPLKIQITLALVFCSMVFNGQTNTNIVQATFTPDVPGCIYYENEFRGHFSVQAPQEFQARMQNDTPCTTIVVNYDGFTPEAQAAFQYAVDLWALSIESSQTITIDAFFLPLGSGVLGAAGSSFVTLNPAVVPDALPNTAYGIPLAEKLANANINGTDADITANFNSNISWYFGTNANPPNNQFDFVTVVLHELAHGMGFIGFASVENNEGSIRVGNPPTIPSIFDTFTENGSGTPLLSFPDPSLDLFLQLTGGDLFCNSLGATAGNGGVQNELFAPPTFQPASSYSHWDEVTFPSGGANSLMTPQLGPGEAIHVIGANTSGFFEDMGWTLCEALSIEDFALNNVKVSPNPFSTELNITLSETVGKDYNLKLLDLNGRVIIEDQTTTTNGRLQLSGLDGLTNALYFIELTDVASGNTVVKKLIKN